MTETIYIPLLDEGTPVWRPAEAWKISTDTYIVLRPADYDPDDEHWAYPPGTTVICERRSMSGEVRTVATRSAKPDRQTA